MQISCELWSINRWLRFTGWRLFVGVPTDPTKMGVEPTRIGLQFHGWRSAPKKAEKPAQETTVFNPNTRRAFRRADEKRGGGRREEVRGRILPMDED